MRCWTWSCANSQNTADHLWELAFVGAGLARDTDTSVYLQYRGDTIAGKPAPTKASCHRFDCV
ncbi:hypothetical protein FIV37_11615 [Pseudomonas gessardii]|nr:hypothetical protein [Pseudomonas gessardii]